MEQSQDQQHLLRPPRRDSQLQHQQEQAQRHSQHTHQHQHQQPTLDSTAQDVLAEARKNLQVLIDSGLSKDLLHQWVDSSLSLQLDFPTQLSLSAVNSSSLVSNRQTAPPPPPPVPQCPPPPPPRSPATTRDSPVSALMPTSMPSAASPVIDIKTEPTRADDPSRAWPAAPTLASDRVIMSGADPDAGLFISPAIPYSHRPRISVSSTSSGSSGHASIWSTNSAQSSLSWHSTSTCPRSQATLPMLPQNSSAPGTPLVNSSQVAAAASATNKQNVYWCTSCETSFKRKYDWKRHEDEFHERWRKYPCPEPGCNRSFWGSNSFNQHHKQCHGCKTCPHAEKVVKFLRKRKYWACGFCSALHPARERHVEHVARHFESGLTKNDWMHSRVVYGLLHQPLIHEAWDALVASKQAEYAGRRPQFSWHPSRTGRAQGFLEKENPGQLQDLLEFFSGDDGEAQWIVTVAYDLADIVLTSAPTISPQYPQATMGPPQTPSAFGRDSQISFNSLPVQTHQQPVLTSATSHNSSSFASPFRNTIFATSQTFSTAHKPSPDSSSHSPLTSSHSPLDERELPPPPPPGDSMMDFEYSPAPVVFEDWESITGAMVETAAQQQPNSSVAQSDWGMAQYFSDPRVAS